MRSVPFGKDLNNCAVSRSPLATCDTVSFVFSRYICGFVLFPTEARISCIRSCIVPELSTSHTVLGSRE